jgi:hypothetical protein
MEMLDLHQGDISISVQIILNRHVCSEHHHLRVHASINLLQQNSVWNENVLDTDHANSLLLLMSNIKQASPGIHSMWCIFA